MSPNLCRFLMTLGKFEAGITPVESELEPFIKNIKEILSLIEESTSDDVDYDELVNELSYAWKPVNGFVCRCMPRSEYPKFVSDLLDLFEAMDKLDCEDFFGTEGWCYRVFGD